MGRAKKTALLTVLVIALWGANPFQRAEAGLVFDQSGIYFLSSLDATAASSGGLLFGHAMLGATIPKIWFIGWSVNYFTRTVEFSGASDSLNVLELGPKFGLYIGKSRAWSLAATINPFVNATYTPSGGSAQSLGGLSFSGELSFAPQVAKNLYAGFKVIYHYSSYSESTVGSTTTSVSYSLSTLLPMIHLSWRFGQQ